MKDSVLFGSRFCSKKYMLPVVRITIDWERLKYNFITPLLLIFVLSFFNLMRCSGILQLSYLIFAFAGRLL